MRHSQVSLLITPVKFLVATVAEMSSGESVIDLERASVINMYKVLLMFANCSRRFAITDRCYMGLVPLCSQLGDGVRAYSGWCFRALCNATEG